ncbi:MAG: hypothetical protein EOP61_39640, partial [Sphingomonadales bacterium]
MSLRCWFAYKALAKAVARALLPMLLILPAPAAQAMRLGGGEEPVALQSGFEGVGRIECRTSGGHAALIDATGWVLGAADTVVTAAHSFYPAGGTVDPRACVFRLYNADGTTRQAARIRYVRSPWSEPGRRNDSAQDIAILKLDRPMRVASIPAAATLAIGARAVRLISYPADSEDR